jgi:hypothetical protein
MHNLHTAFPQLNRGAAMNKERLIIVLEQDIATSKRECKDLAFKLATYKLLEHSTESFLTNEDVMCEAWMASALTNLLEVVKAHRWDDCTELNRHRLVLSRKEAYLLDTKQLREKLAQAEMDEVHTASNLAEEGQQPDGHDLLRFRALPKTEQKELAALVMRFKGSYAHEDAEAVKSFRAKLKLAASSANVESHDGALFTTRQRTIKEKAKDIRFRQLMADGDLLVGVDFGDSDSTAICVLKNRTPETQLCSSTRDGRFCSKKANHGGEDHEYLSMLPNEFFDKVASFTHTRGEPKEEFLKRLDFHFLPDAKAPLVNQLVRENIVQLAAPTSSSVNDPFPPRARELAQESNCPFIHAAHGRCVSTHNYIRSSDSTMHISKYGAGWYS